MPINFEDAQKGYLRWLNFNQRLEATRRTGDLIQNREILEDRFTANTYRDKDVRYTPRYKTRIENITKGS